MKRFLVLLLLLALVIAGFGFYRGWFTVNQAMIRQDEKTAQEKVRALEQKLQDKSADSSGHDADNE